MDPHDVPDATATILYVGNLDKRVTDEMMLNILRAGLPHVQEKILNAKMFQPMDLSQGPEGYSFIQFQDNNSACQAMTFLNGREFCGKKVKVNWATNSGNGGVPKVIGSSFTIFVGDIDDDLNDSELRQAFNPFGEILNAKVVRDAATEKSKNYGFISFTNKPDAERAIREMHGSMLKRRPIKTNWATRNQKTTPTQLDYDQVYKETSEDNCTVYVTNLPDRIPEDVLINYFKTFGKIMGTPRVFEGKNYAFIKYNDHASAATAIVKGNGAELHGSVLKCWWGKDNDASVNASGQRRSSNYSNNSNYSQNSNNYHQIQPHGQPVDSAQNTYAQQYQQYMQYMNNPYYQQQYYQYWMQQYQQQQQNAGQQQPGAQHCGYPYGQQMAEGGGYPQQQGNYQQQNYQGQ